MSDPKNSAQKALRAMPDLRGIYQHRKGGVYTLYSATINESTMEPTVHYYSPTHDSRWTRTLADWTEEVEGKPRFWWIREATIQELLQAADIPLP